MTPGSPPYRDFCLAGWVSRIAAMIELHPLSGLVRIEIKETIPTSHSKSVSIVGSPLDENMKIQKVILEIFQYQ